MATDIQIQQSFFSDYHKDTFGFRPRGGTPEEWNSLEWLDAQIKSISDYLDSVKQTREGRNYLRDDGWFIDSPSAEEDEWEDPMVAYEREIAEQDHARWLEQQEQAELNAAYDDQYDHLVK